ncbi:uncharacterized protein LOC127736766 [Mytilus californianus]|uniref:uncharacterized protein LOC127736766 n=1 Tax=Mytilus californianus TaxID=6549 RepID=UPI00224676D1|nr:uncharacterized protein LOC127736766 [Mytilus californianus]
MRLILSSNQKGIGFSFVLMRTLWMVLTKSTRILYLLLPPFLLLLVIWWVNLKKGTNSSGSLITQLGDGLRLENMKITISPKMMRSRKRFARPRLEPSKLLRRKRPALSRIQLDLLQQLEVSLLPLLLLQLTISVAINSPFVPALHGLSRAPWTSVTTASSMVTGEGTAHSTSSQPQLLHPVTSHPNSNDTVTVNDKYLDISLLSSSYECNNDELDEFMSQVQFLEKLDFSASHNFKGVKGRLAKHYDFWVKIGASDFVFDTIKNGYVIPFLVPPPSMHMKNNKSAVSNSEFVDKAVLELVDSGCAYEIPFTPYIVNPLSVATNKSGKKRLILDLSILNKSVKKERFKFEDWKTPIQFFKRGSYLFKFDLKSCYHHYDICPQQQTFLGFSWNNKYYCFSVLVFGLASSPYLFTKCLRSMVKYWRQNSIDIVLYLDDVFGMASDYELCRKDSDFVKKSLKETGFLVNIEKSVFEPTQKLEWLGITWDSAQFCISIPERRLNDLLQSIDEILDRFLFFSARQLAQVTGKIISLSPVFGNLTRLMTRYCYLCIVQRLSWNKLLQIVYPAEILNELKFWKSNVLTLNKKKLAMYSPSSIVIFSDASNVACGAYTVELENNIFHKMWNELERCKSSTWREMRAIEQALLSFSTLFMGKSLKWFTDNQNCVRIVQARSMKEDLQNLAYSIFCICKEHNIFIELQWIPRTLNSKADYISKMSDHEDWQISNKFFEFLESLWGLFTVDRFASVMNNKTKRFNSLFWNPTAEAVDAFTKNWHEENNWLVPLFI